MKVYVHRPLAVIFLLYISGRLCSYQKLVLRRYSKSHKSEDEFAILIFSTRVFSTRLSSCDSDLRTKNRTANALEI